MAATWGQLGALKGFQELQNTMKIRENSGSVSEERPEPLRIRFGVDFGRFFGGILKGFGVHFGRF